MAQVTGTILDQGGAVFHPRAYGAAGDGLADDATALYALLNGPDLQAGGTVVVSERYRLATSLAVPARVSLLFAPGGMLIPDANTALSIEGTVSAGAYAAFGGAGAVQLGPRAADDVRPEWWGAVADGTTDSAPAVARAVASLPPGGGTVVLGSGTYALGAPIVVNRSDLVLRGQGPWRTVLTRHATGGALMQSASNASVRNVVVEDLAFDPGVDGYTAYAVAFNGWSANEITVRRCRFWNARNGNFIGLQRISRATVEDCLFHSPGNARGVAINLGGGCRDIHIRRNRFLWVHDGILFDTGSTRGNEEEQVTEYVTIQDNYFDLGWWHLVWEVANEGSTVTYTGTTLRDTSTDFSSFSPPGTDVYHTIRVMPELRTGTASLSGVRLEDAAAAFTTYTLEPGEIVRCGGAFGVISSVESDTVLWVEEWLSDADRRPVAAPPSGSAYTVYRVYLGEVAAASGDTITVPRWWTLTGATVTPGAGKRYEILVRRCNYPIHMEYSARRIMITGNTLRRGFADQVSVYGYDAQITGNRIEDGQDMGVTLHGRNNVVTGNRVRHQGAGGIWTTSDDSVIAENVVTDSQWENFVNTVHLGDIIVYEGSRNLIAHNHCRRETVVLGLNGIVVVAGTGVSDHNRLLGNTSAGHLTADLRLRGAGTTSTQLHTNQGSTLIDGAVGTDFGTLQGIGAPEGSVGAGVGTLYRRLDGAPGATLYVKESNQQFTNGWRAV